MSDHHFVNVLCILYLVYLRFKYQNHQIESTDNLMSKIYNPDETIYCIPNNLLWLILQ